MTDKFIFFSETNEPNNWVFDRPENLPFPYLNYIKNNYDLILNTQEELICIRCTKEINFQNYGDIETFCNSNTVFCPECNINMIVLKSKIPEPFDQNLNMWHILAFGLFANRPISDDDSDNESDYDSDNISELENNYDEGCSVMSTISSRDVPFKTLAINNKDLIINDFIQNHGGGVCILCHKKMITSDDKCKIENGGKNVHCNFCSSDVVVPISEVPEPFEDTLEKWRFLRFGTLLLDEGGHL